MTKDCRPEERGWWAGSGRGGGGGRGRGGLVEELGDGALVDAVGDGDAEDPVDVADAGVEDAGAVGEEGVGGALDATAAALLPVGDDAAAVGAAVEGVEESGPVEAGRGGDVGQDGRIDRSRRSRKKARRAASSKRSAASGPPSSPATLTASMAGSRVDGQVSRLGGANGRARAGSAPDLLAQGRPRGAALVDQLQGPAAPGHRRLADRGLARRRRMEKT